MKAIKQIELTEEDQKLILDFMKLVDEMAEYTGKSIDDIFEYLAQNTAVIPGTSVDKVSCDWMLKFGNTIPIDDI